MNKDKLSKVNLKYFYTSNASIKYNYIRFASDFLKYIMFYVKSSFTYIILNRFKVKIIE